MIRGPLSILCNLVAGHQSSEGREGGGSSFILRAADGGSLLVYSSETMLSTY